MPPCVAGSGASASVTARFAEGFTTVLAVALLFAAAGSVTVVLTLAVLLSVPAAVGVITTVRTVVAPLARVPRLQVTVPAACVQGAVAETKVTPAGKVSVSTVLAAGDGPAFATVMV